MRQRKIFYAYIMASRTRALYIGVTSDIELRVKQHKNHRYEGFTDKYKCGRLVYFERHGDPSMAIARESQLKTWRREKKVQLIERENSTWQDLSETWGKPIELYKAPRPIPSPTST